ncbi:MAG: hypothetical protein ACE5F1_14785, partial [Planctomycetota bacterium]
FVEADSYDGPSLILAYSHCIAHGINMRTGLDAHKQAVDCGHWPLFRYDPRRAARGENPLQLDSRAPKIPFEAFLEALGLFPDYKQAHLALAETCTRLGRHAEAARHRALARPLRRNTR